MKPVLHIQEFYVRVAADRPVTGTEMLRGFIERKGLPEPVQTIEFGDVENAPAVWEEALRRFAQKRGWRIVEEVPA